MTAKRQYEFCNLKYATLLRGVYVQGDVYLNGRKVGVFEQQPYAAVIASVPGGIHPTEAGRLLYEAEDRLLAKQQRRVGW